jgi:hypothetical protein
MNTKNRTMKQCIFIMMVVSLLCACNSSDKKAVYSCRLVETEKRLTFELDRETTYNFYYAWVFTEKDGHEYFSFLNYYSNQILFYDFNTQKFLFKTELPREGPNGVFPIMGYYVHGFDQMYIAALSFEGLIQIDTAARIVKKLPYGETPDGYPVNNSFWPSSSKPYKPPVFIGNKLYITQKPHDSRTAAIERPIAAVLDTAMHIVEKFPFTFQKMLTEKHFQKEAGGKLDFSREFDGKRFIYSFYGNEDIFVASIDHQSVERRIVKSQYIDKIVFETILSDPHAGTRQELEIAKYGDLLYDPYRDVYYRFAYPKTELDPNKSYFKKALFGRKKFSVIILDNDLNIIGETLFPEGIYNSHVYFVHRDGLYISRDYQIGEDQSDDFLNYTCFELKKQ